MRGAVTEPFTYRAGIHLDFTTGLHYACSATTRQVTRGFTSLFTFTGDNKSYYMGPAGLLVPSATNTPRIEYDANGACLGLKMEVARTNLGLHSADGTNAAWVKTTCTAAKTATGPDGVANSATTLTATAGNALCLQTVVSLSATRAYGIWLKRRTGTGNIDMTVDGGVTWTTKTITSSWARYTISQTAVVNPVFGLRIVTDTDAVDFWGSQLESANFSSSDIPTTTASVTRAAETCQRTLGTEFSATAGTVHAHARASGGNEASPQYLWVFTDGTFAENIRMSRVANSTTLRFGVTDGNVAQAAIDATLTNSTTFRVGVAWGANDFAFSNNGAAIQTDTAGTLPTVTKMNIGQFTDGAENFNGHILKLDYWPERKSNGFLVSDP